MTERAAVATLAQVEVVFSSLRVQSFALRVVEVRMCWGLLWS